MQRQLLGDDHAIHWTNKYKELFYHPNRFTHMIIVGWAQVQITGDVNQLCILNVFR